MPLANYPDFHPSGRLDRAIRTVWLASVAALIGLIVGGVSVFAVVSALTTGPSRRDLPADAAKGSETTAVKRPAPVATPRPVQTEPARNVPEPPTGTAIAPPVQTQTPTQTLPPAQLQTPERRAANESKHRATEPEALPARSGRNSEEAKYRASVSRSQAVPNVDTADVPAAGDRRPLWDFFGNPNLRDAPDTADRPEESRPLRESDGRQPRSDHRAKGGRSRSRVAHRGQGGEATDSDQPPPAAWRHRRGIIAPGRREYSDEQADGGFFGLFGSGKWRSGQRD